jgi:YVTN family beta-propeller protein
MLFVSTTLLNNACRMEKDADVRERILLVRRVRVNNEDTNTLYVANSRSDSISVINGKDNTKIGEDIAVGDGPVAIDIIYNTGTVYVAHLFSDTVSVIDAVANKVVAGITF